MIMAKTLDDVAFEMEQLVEEIENLVFYTPSEITSGVRNAIQDNFNNDQDFYSRGGWSIEESTRKRKKGISDKILVRTGALQSELDNLVQEGDFDEPAIIDRNVYDDFDNAYPHKLNDEMGFNFIPDDNAVNDLSEGHGELMKDSFLGSYWGDLTSEIERLVYEFLDLKYEAEDLRDAKGL